MIPALLLLAQAADPISAAIATMTPEQKAAQLQSTAPADPAIGLPAYDWWNEGLHGLARDGQATVFPQAIGLAATWDTDLLGKVGTVVSTEARAKFNAQPVTANRRIYQGLTIWSPNINIFRDPRWGRGQETYGEDPYLTGTLGVAFVQGLQGPDPAHPRVVATPKHFAVHSGPEAGRDSFDVDPSPRDLEATYFPAFRRTITEGRAMSLMCAYNSIHGVPACASSPLMNERLRRDWGFTGFTVSDCDAVGNISSYHHYRLDTAGGAAAAVRGGTDVNCGSAYAALPQALKQGLITQAEVDTALTRAFRARQALGIAFGGTSPYSRIRPDQVGTPAHQAIALEAARKSIVLLQNNADRLPLKAGAKIAVIGADADDLGVLQGNYHGTAIRPVTPLDGIRARFGAANVRYAQGSALADGAAVVVPETALRSGGKPGLRADYSGPASVTRQDRRIDLDFNRAPAAPGLPIGPFKANWTGEFVPPGPGQYRLIIDQSQCWKDCTTHDSARVTLGGKVLHDGPLPKGRVEMTVDSDGTPQPIAITLDHVSDDESFRLLWMPPAQPLLDQAVAAVRDADVAIVVAGLSPDLEGEALSVSVPGFVGGDRTDIALPLPQQRLLAALKATGKPIVLVLSSGSAVSVDPTSADAILANWYPGEAGGTALADVLSGVTNPGGRLPVTFYRATTDLPAFIDYAMKERTYRYFTGTPLWGFGHGLSYTRFGYAAPRGAASVAAGQPLTVQTTVTNTGARDGDEVVQAYLVPPPPPPPPHPPARQHGGGVATPARRLPPHKPEARQGHGRRFHPHPPRHEHRRPRRPPSRRARRLPPLRRRRPARRRSGPVVRLRRDRHRHGPAEMTRDVSPHTPSPRTCSGVHPSARGGPELLASPPAAKWTPDQVRGDGGELSRRHFLAAAAATAASAATPAFAAPAFPSKRPAPADRRFVSPAVERDLTRVAKLIGDPKLRWMFGNCYPNTLDTTVRMSTIDGKPDAFVITGDIPCLWLRDSSAQLKPYLHLVKTAPELRRLFTGLIARQARCILIDSYANAFMEDPTAKSNLEWSLHDDTVMKPGVAERKWEVDSLCYPMRLAHQYWRATGDKTPFDATWAAAAKRSIATFREQQRLDGHGPYSFRRSAPQPTETLLWGYGNPTKPNGLIHSGFRPSDDSCTYPMLIPSNLFAMTALRELATVAQETGNDGGIVRDATALALEIESALRRFGTMRLRDGREVWAYEVDGFGNALFMDDANVPSLSGLAYLGCVDPADPLWQRTRDACWSDTNPWFFKGAAGEGIGGPHVGEGQIWPMSLTIRALTSTDDATIRACLKTLRDTDGGTGFIHESFDRNDPAKFTRSWFAWANGLFAELILHLAKTKPALLKETF